MKRILKALVIVLVVAMVVYLLLPILSGIRRQALEEYTYSSGGDMIGSLYSESVKLVDETHALITKSSNKAYYSKPETSEYLVDAKILDDIKAIFIKYNMYNWNGRRLSNIFVADGASHSYRFYFEDKDIYFSSQVVPKLYYSKLEKIDEVISSYLKDAQQVPGLLMDDKKDEEGYNDSLPVEGQITLEIYSYSKKVITAEFKNGTNEVFEVPDTYTLVNNETGLVVSEGKYNGPSCVYENGIEEGYFKLDEFLTVGTYTLTIGEYSVQFEIR